jgi:hypothetical protein
MGLQRRHRWLGRRDRSSLQRCFDLLWKRMWHYVSKILFYLSPSDIEKRWLLKEVAAISMNKKIHCTRFFISQWLFKRKSIEQYYSHFGTLKIVNPNAERIAVFLFKWRNLNNKTPFKEDLLNKYWKGNIFNVCLHLKLTGKCVI